MKELFKNIGLGLFVDEGFIMSAFDLALILATITIGYIGYKLITFKLG